MIADRVAFPFFGDENVLDPLLPHQVGIFRPETAFLLRRDVFVLLDRPSISHCHDYLLFPPHFKRWQLFNPCLIKSFTCITMEVSVCSQFTVFPRNGYTCPVPFCVSKMPTFSFFSKFINGSFHISFL